MLHGKHVMVRVGGGWDTLKGFLLKYDPDRVLQFTTLEQKILAYQKGPSGSGPAHRVQAAQPPTMDPIAAVNLLPESSSSSSSSTTSASKPNMPTPRAVAQSPASTPSMPRRAAAPKKILHTPTASPKTTPLSSPVPKRTPLPTGVSQKAASATSKTKLRPRGSPSQPRSPVCPEPTCKLPKPSAPPTSVQKPAQRDARPPPAPVRSRLAQRRPPSPASALHLESRKGRPVSPRLAPNDPKQTIPLAKPCKSKSVEQNTAGATRTVTSVNTKTTHRKPLVSSNPPVQTPAVSSTTKPAPNSTTHKHTARTKPSKRDEPYFEMNNKRRVKN